MKYNTKKIEKNIKKVNEPIAFLLGIYLTTGLGVVRSLGRKGVPVFWLDNDSKQIGFRSKYCTGILCPDPKNNEKEYIDFLLNIGEKLRKKGVLFPTGDIETVTILKNRGKLEKYFRIPMADLEVSNIFLNKRIFYQTLEKHNLPHPLTFFPDDISKLKDVSIRIKYPCIVKPSYSGYFRSDFNTKFFIAKSSNHLIELYNKALSENHDVMIQEIIPGNARNMHGLNAYFDRKSNPRGIFMYRRIREWPIDFGNGCSIENVNIPKLQEMINPFVKKIKYYGILDAEYRKDPRDGEFKFIEVNARCWMQCGLPTRCGINLPYIAFMDSIGEKVENIVLCNEKIKWLLLSCDIGSSIVSMAKKELNFGEWIKSLRGKKEYAFLAKDDLLPFFIYYLTTLYSDIPHYFKKVIFK